MPSPGSARDAAFAAFEAHREPVQRRQKLAAFLVIRDAASIAEARNQPPGIRWFFDGEGSNT